MLAKVWEKPGKFLMKLQIAARGMESSVEVSQKTTIPLNSFFVPLCEGV